MCLSCGQENTNEKNTHHGPGAVLRFCSYFSCIVIGVETAAQRGE